MQIMKAKLQAKKSFMMLLKQGGLRIKMVWGMNAAVGSLEENDPTLGCKHYHDIKFTGASSKWLFNFPLRD